MNKKGILPVIAGITLSSAAIITIAIVLGVLLLFTGFVTIAYGIKLIGMFLLVMAGIVALKGGKDKYITTLLIAGGIMFLWDFIKEFILNIFV